MIKKIIIAVILIVVLLVATIAVVSFASPTDFRVEREKTIKRPRTEIYNYVKILKNQNDWGPWFKKEPTMQQEFVGTDGTAGFISRWNSKSEEIGEGEQEIKTLIENERMDTEVRFKRPFESIANGSIALEPVDDASTKVKWSLSGSMPRPLNIMMLMVDMDEMMGKDIGEGLGSLKMIMENKPVS